MKQKIVVSEHIFVTARLSKDGPVPLQRILQKRSHKNRTKSARWKETLNSNKVRFKIKRKQFKV